MSTAKLHPRYDSSLLVRTIWIMAVLILIVGPFAFAQTSDSLATPSTVPIAMYRTIFDTAWTRAFVKLWNENHDTARVLARMGPVHFVSLGPETTAVLMEFDSSGRARMVSVSRQEPTDTLPIFTASYERWAEFMEGKFSAVAGVITRKIHYRGNFALAIKYGVAFDKVAPVGKRASQMIVAPPSK